jgi:hypothetical protein
MIRHGPYTLTLVMAAVWSGLTTTGFADAIDEQQGTFDSQAEAIRNSLGRPVDFNRNSTVVDLNGDGVVNILDAGLFRLGINRIGEGRGNDGVPSAALQGERIVVEPQSSVVISGSSLSVLFLIRDNTTPLAGYTLDVTVTGEPGTMGTVTANVAATDFYDVQNLITAGGASRDPFFSVVQGSEGGGVSLSTMTDDLSTVLAVDGVNDVLGQVVFEVSEDAHGDFTIQLTPSSALADGNFDYVPFTFAPATIRALNPALVPAASDWGLLVLGLLTVTAGSLLLRKGLNPLTATRPG